MKIGELKKLIAALPDDMLVVAPGGDHSYNEAEAGKAKAEVHRNTRGRIEHIGEYYDERNRSEKTSTIETVLVVGA